MISHAAPEARLRAIVRDLERCIVAFSGGVDSGLLLALAHQELGAGATGITGVSASVPQREIEAARAFARTIGANHELLPTDELDDERYRANPVDRCFYCKHELYGKLQALAQARHIPWVVDGLNADDTSDYRPGRRAADSFNIRSPLAEANFGKDDVRELARRLGLELWDKPALACLSSRFPHGTRISAAALQQVERAEQAVLDSGFRQCRVRHHGDVARLELPAAELERATVPEVRAALLAGIKAAGYRYVALDLGGFVSGNLNPEMAHASETRRKLASSELPP